MMPFADESPRCGAGLVDGSRVCLGSRDPDSELEVGVESNLTIVIL